MNFKTTLACLLLFALTPMLAAQTKLSGTAHCGKPDQQQTLEVGDRSGHLLSLSKTTCTWTKPMEIGGAQNKELTLIASDDIRGELARGRGYVVDTMTSGDKAFVSFVGTTTLKNSLPQALEGRWRYTGGTGKLKGIKGTGTYKGTGAEDGSVTYEVEGEYELPEGK